MPCWVQFELEDEWKRLVDSHIGEQASGEDSPTMRLYWRIIEHRSSSEVCRDELTVRWIASWEIVSLMQK